MASSDDGFSLVDALVGVAFVSALTVGAANLFVVSVALVHDARDDGNASVLAIQKIEQLRVAYAATASLPSSPANSLDEDVPGFSDRPDAYVRRWSVASLPSDLSSRRVLQVRVLAVRRASHVPPGSGDRARVAGEVLVTTLAASR
jgi:hypothetical protein